MAGRPRGFPAPEKIAAAAQALKSIAVACFPELAKRPPTEVVASALAALEADPQFNAGLGGAIQSDGEVRVSAAIMDGARQSFSGVINALRVKHPSRHRVVSSVGEIAGDLAAGRADARPRT